MTVAPILLLNSIQNNKDEERIKINSTKTRVFEEIKNFFKQKEEYRKDKFELKGNKIINKFKDTSLEVELFFIILISFFILIHIIILVIIAIFDLNLPDFFELILIVLIVFSISLFLALLGLFKNKIYPNQEIVLNLTINQIERFVFVRIISYDCEDTLLKNLIDYLDVKFNEGNRK